MSVTYKTQCPRGGGGSRCWDWIGIPLGRRVQLGAENPARERGERPALEGAAKSTPAKGFPGDHGTDRSLQSPLQLGEVGSVVILIPASRRETEALCIECRAQSMCCKIPTRPQGCWEARAGSARHGTAQGRDCAPGC